MDDLAVLVALAAEQGAGSPVGSFSLHLISSVQASTDLRLKEF